MRNRGMSDRIAETMKSMLGALKYGRITLVPMVMSEGKRLSCELVECISDNVKGRGRLLLSHVGSWEDRLYFDYAGSQICCRREIRNSSPHPLPLQELGLELHGLRGAGVPADDFYYHVENPRIFGEMTYTVDQAAVDGQVKSPFFSNENGEYLGKNRIGGSPHQPFPALLLGNYKSNHGLVHGTLSQNVFYHSYEMRHEADGSVCLCIYSGFKCTDSRIVGPGEILVDEWYLGCTEEALAIDHVFDGYTSVLRKKLPPLYGATDINRNAMVWGSWNDGVFRRVDQEMLLEEARFLKESFPTVRWFQLDDGYAVCEEPAHGLGVPYEKGRGINHRKFPHGLRSYTDKVREIGLRPALWIGGLCPNHSLIVKEHPEWFVDYFLEQGEDKSSPFDVSLPEVREVMCQALDTLCLEYGFEGVKHDFWSYAFEVSRDYYHDRSASGYEWRRWWLTEFRKRLPADGYLESCCDVAMANPFLSEWVSNYRFGFDIGSGNWKYIRTNYLWGVACLATHTGDLSVPNCDSVGLFLPFSDEQFMFWMNFCLVTHSMVELAGRLSQHQDSPRMALLQKAVCNPHNGQDVYCAGWDYCDRAQPYPRTLYFNTAHFCPEEGQPGLPLKTVGMFNLDDSNVSIILRNKDLGLKDKAYRVTDVWSGVEMTLEESLTIELPRHGSRLLAISETTVPQLLDANIRVLGSSWDGKQLTLRFDYGAMARLLFDRKPSIIQLNGQAWGQATSDGYVEGLIRERSEMSVVFS